MKRTPVLFALLLFTSTTANYNCDLSEECSSSLADLITNLAIGAVSISAGVPFDVPSAVINVKNTVESCKGDIRETLAAGASHSRLKIDYDPNGSGNFSQSELNNNFQVPSIEPGDTCICDYGFQFNEPGDYRLITFADDMEEVDERDDNNNASAPTIVNPRSTTQEYGNALIIRVLPNPNFKKRPGQPNVEVLSYTVRQ
jgi:hypothetical protein